MSDRLLLVTADDFGIGPETTRGILDLAERGVVTSTVLLANSPFAEDAVRQWRAGSRSLELGWHPCLTLDSPLLPPDRVPSLIGVDGRFHPLGQFLIRLAFGRIDALEVEAELRAQLERFVELVGRPPVNVNAHHHVHVFPRVGAALARVLAGIATRPFLRRVSEPLRTLFRVPGARLKRAFLWSLGRRRALAFSGNDVLIGITDPPRVHDPRFFARWLSEARGQYVELCCHPGYPDRTLTDRDPDPAQRRSREQELLAAAEFLDAVRAAGFRLVSAAEMREQTDYLCSWRSKARSHSGSISVSSSVPAARSVT